MTSASRTTLIPELRASPKLYIRSAIFPAEDCAGPAYIPLSTVVIKINLVFSISDTEFEQWSHNTITQCWERLLYDHVSLTPYALFFPTFYLERFQVNSKTEMKVQWTPKTPASIITVNTLAHLLSHTWLYKCTQMHIFQMELKYDLY